MCEIVRGEMYGYPSDMWNRAKDEALRALMEEARRGSPIFYSDLTKHISSIGFGPHDYAFHHLLGEISVEEDAAGRGMLSALVVHKEDGMPGQGFFDLARQLGRDIGDRVQCWVQETKRVVDYWAVQLPHEVRPLAQ